MSVLAPIAAMIIQMAISRSREFLADSTGAKTVGNPLGLASALAKLARANEMAPMEARPETAHMFIVNPLRGGFTRLFRAVRYSASSAPTHRSRKGSRGSAPWLIRNR